tara:strand:- start:138 stop:626 length:489 start_codon:yes stop_codon:yes gene_type:complete
MIQIHQAETSSIASNEINLKLTDNNSISITMMLGYKPLISLYSQVSKREYTFYPISMTNTNDERYTTLSWLNYPADSLPAVENRTGGLAVMGTESTPYGLYELNIYASTNPLALDPNYPIIMNRSYTGLANLTLIPASTQAAVKYTEYDSNEDDYNAVYRTN